jgi:hypothetical protein
MFQYRYVTPTRSGKWYPTVQAAQKAADRIGAGFHDDIAGKFYPYVFAVLETRLAPNPSGMVAILSAAGGRLQRHPI